MPGKQPIRNEQIIKNNVNKTSSLHNDLQTEYILDYSKAKPNRFAGQSDEKRVVVVLDPDVSEIFATPDSVNKTLQLIGFVPQKARKKA